MVPDPLLLPRAFVPAQMIGDRIEDTRSLDETIDWIETIYFEVVLREHTNIADYMRTAKVLVFVDESNVVSSVRALGRKLARLKLRVHLANADKGRELIEMF